MTSLLTDTASEAIYPLLPVFLTSVLRASAVSLGLIEGLAEAANSLLKVLSGHVSDRWRRRKLIVIAGYTLSSAVRPLVGLAGTWPHVLAVRLTDRVGKGIRGAPRDAILAAVATPETRGRIFGFHRAMDHVGAIVGPLLASLFLVFYPGQYRTLFLLTLVPGALAVWTLFRIPDDRDTDGTTTTRHAGAGPSRVVQNAVGPPLAQASRLPRQYFVFLMVLVLFTLGNSTDAFLLLRLSECGVPTPVIPVLWAGLHVVKAAFSVIGGAQSDRLGRRIVIGTGWLIYAVVYAGFATATSATALVSWFLAYGLYYGFTEGAEKALVADLAPADRRGTAFGIYQAILGVGSFLASVCFGLIWKLVGAGAAFGTGAALAVAASLLLFMLVREPRRAATSPKG